MIQDITAVRILMIFILIHLLPFSFIKIPSSIHLKGLKIYSKILSPCVK